MNRTRKVYKGYEWPLWMKIGAVVCFLIVGVIVVIGVMLEHSYDAQQNANATETAQTFLTPFPTSTPMPPLTLTCGKVEKGSLQSFRTGLKLSISLICVRGGIQKVNVDSGIYKSLSGVQGDGDESFEGVSTKLHLKYSDYTAMNGSKVYPKTVTLSLKE